MDISPPAGSPPPSLRPDGPDRPSAATLNPVARRTLNPYLFRDALPWRAHDLPKEYPLARAVALTAGDKSVPPELLPRLHSVLQETRFGGGLYLRDVVNLRARRPRRHSLVPSPRWPHGRPPRVPPQAARSAPAWRGAPTTRTSPAGHHTASPVSALAATDTPAPLVLPKRLPGRLRQ